uniref:Uncharacterized protein n=1 Tax=Sphaerodactylus townsendi TaxID=933632 RepID=A0ACB8F166_9SAUR
MPSLGLSDARSQYIIFDAVQFLGEVKLLSDMTLSFFACVPVFEDDDGGSAPLKSNASNHKDKNVRQRNAN